MKKTKKANIELYGAVQKEDIKIRKLINSLVGGYNFSLKTITTENVSLETITKMEAIGKSVIKLSTQIDELGEF
jgi:hypothetical protein